MSLLRRFAGTLRRASRRARNTRVIDARELYRYWEEEQLRRLFRTYAPDFVFDIGANKGQYATMLRRRVGYKGLIASFEPDPAAAHVLKARARGDDKWLVSDHAISVQDGEQAFNIMMDSEFNSLSTPDHSQTALFKEKNIICRTMTIKTETLASALRRLQEEFGFQRPFVKLDTQGSDARIIEASEHVMHEFIGLQSELSVRKLYAHSTDFRDALSLYQRCGFVLSALVPNNAGHFPVLVETDCIMVNRTVLSEDR